MKKGRHHDTCAGVDRSSNNLLVWQKIYALCRQPIVGQRFQDEGSAQIAGIGGEVIEDANSRIFAGDQAICFMANAGSLERRHLIPRHASM